jgi:hypothetical protein
MLTTALKQDQKGNYYQEADKIVKGHRMKFYHACLDRIDALITEKNSAV